MACLSCTSYEQQIIFMRNRISELEQENESLIAKLGGRQEGVTLDEFTGLTKVCTELANRLNALQDRVDHSLVAAQAAKVPPYDRERFFLDHERIEKLEKRCEMCGEGGQNIIDHENKIGELEKQVKNILLRLRTVEDIAVHATKALDKCDVLEKRIANAQVRGNNV